MLASIIALLGLTTLAAPTNPADPAMALDRQTIKVASLVPDGSIWANSLREMGESWRSATDGRVRMRLYPGGVAGDEADVVRKMRIGQLDGATLTVAGLGTISDKFNVFEIPRFFETNEEALHVLEELTPFLRETLRAEGFELVHWGHTGWVHLFSTAPIHKLDDLREQKMFVWGDSNRMVEWWKERGFKPIALSATDILPSLQTGLIDVFPSPPLSALALQWYRSAPYMMEVGVMPYFGATIVTTKTWDALSQADREALLSVGAEIEARLMKEVPEHERKGIEEMQKRGLTVVSLGKNESEFQDLSESFAKHMGGNLVPQDVLDLARKARDAWRSKPTDG